MPLPVDLAAPGGGHFLGLAGSRVGLNGADADKEFCRGGILRDAAGGQVSGRRRMANVKGSAPP
jgi:hypothetical protein